MENSDIIKFLQKFLETESEESNVDNSTIEKVIEKILSLPDLKVAVGSEGQLAIALPREELQPYLKDLDLKPDQERKYLNIATRRILRILGDLIFNEKAPEGDIEKKIFEKFDVSGIRIRAKLKQAYTLPVIDNIEVYKATVSIDNELVEYYLLKIEHLKSKSPTTLNFLITRSDLVKLHKALSEVLENGDAH